MVLNVSALSLIGFCIARSLEKENLLHDLEFSRIMKNMSSRGKIKVAYVVTPVDFGGAEKVSLMFLRNVDRTLFDIHAITLIRPWEKYNFLTDALCEISHHVHKVPVANKPKEQGRDYLRIPRCCRLIHAFLKEGAFDLVHTHGYFADIVATPSSKLFGIPHLSTCHGFISDGGKLSFYNMINRLVLRFSDKIIAVSNDIQRDLVKSGIRMSKIVVIKNAAEAVNQDTLKQIREKNRRLLSVSNDEFVIGYVGRLSKEKGVEYLVEATALLHEKGIKVITIIIGDGPEKHSLEDLAKSSNTQDSIIFLGFEKQPEKWLPTMDAFVLPSLSEGTPMALLEAMSHGLPVIASAVGGIPDIIESMRNGILVPAGQAQKIANSLSILQGNAALRQIIGTAGQQTVQSNYNGKDWTKIIEKEYLNLVC
jgi:glycosyltransferase involved in cell wall biosynthesis